MTMFNYEILTGSNVTPEVSKEHIEGFKYFDAVKKGASLSVPDHDVTYCSTLINEYFKGQFTHYIDVNKPNHHIFTKSKGRKKSNNRTVCENGLPNHWWKKSFTMNEAIRILKLIKPPHPPTTKGFSIVLGKNLTEVLEEKDEKVIYSAVPSIGARRVGTGSHWMMAYLLTVYPELTVRCVVGLDSEQKMKMYYQCLKALDVN